LTMKFIRIKDADLLPKRLVEDNKDRNYPVERFYQYMNTVLTDGQGNFNPLEYLNLIIEEEHNEIIGYLWYSINILDNEVFINTISVDKAHRKNGEVLNQVLEELKTALESTDFDSVKTLSSRSAWHKKNGLVQSKYVLLEYKLNKSEAGHGQKKG